ncbi:MAG: type IV toxin-antitoxin system AbiEi family antitoxin [Bacteroidia bacterium]|nr:type IV toxin-antitoxin system AbiEi family antitoxin [Bacteroidia bacterium]
MLGVAEYISKSLQYEEYAFTWEELKKDSFKTDVALKNELSRLVNKGEIVNLRQGFYLILPPRYRSYHKVPLELYSEKLFKYLNKPYYIGLYSAAAFYGASHQQVQKDYLITQFPNIRNIKKGVIFLNLFACSYWPPKNILQKKSDAGYFNVSSPALTAIDLIHYQSKLGGINRILAIIEELMEEIKTNDIQELLSWYPHTSSIQRLCFLLSELQADPATVNLFSEYLKGENYFPVLLSPDKNRRPGSTDNIWKVDVNIELESDI